MDQQKKYEEDIEESLEKFLKEQLEGDFDDEEEEIKQIIQKLKQSKNLQMTFKSILSDYGKKGTQLKIIVKSFKETAFYQKKSKEIQVHHQKKQIEIPQNDQLIPTIDNYENQRILLRDLFCDIQKMLESNIKIPFHQCKLYEIILESLVTKYDILKEEFKNMTNRETRSSNTIKQILKEIVAQIEKQGRINNQIIKCIIDIQNNKGSLLDHLMTIKKQLNPIDVMDLNRLIQKNKNAEAELKDKSIILFIGDTGSGKTTTILSLLGFRMTKKKLKGMTWVTTTQPLTDQKLKLLHSSPELKSITRYPLAVLPKERLDKNEQIWFVDTPGFGDSAGTEVDLANGIGTIKAIKGCKNVRIAIVISKQSWGIRGSGIRSLAKLLGNIFNNYQDIKNSVIHIFNRFTVDELKELHSSIENLLQNLNEEDKTNQNLMSLYVDLLMKTQKYQDIINFDPLIQDQYKRVLKKIHQLYILKDPSNAFSFSFTQKTLNNIKQQCSIFESMIRYHYQQRNYEIVKYYYNNYKLFNQLVDRRDIKNGFANITNQLENLAKQYFDLAQLKFNDRLSRNFLTKEDITSYQSKIKQAEKYQCLQDCIKIIRKEDLELNLVNQVSALIERLLTQEYLQKQLLKSILFLNENFHIESFQQLLEKINKRIDECKESILKTFNDRNYQACAKQLNNIKVKFQLKAYVDKKFTPKEEMRKIQQEICLKIFKWSEEYVQYYNNLSRGLDKIQKMNEIQKDLNDITICYPLMKALEQSSKITEKIQSLRIMVLENVNKQCQQLNKLLDEKNTEGIKNKISQKFKKLQMYKALNWASSDIRRKLNMVKERIKIYLNIQTSQLDQFCQIIQKKQYQQKNIKFRSLLSKLDKILQSIKIFIPFRNDQQKYNQYKRLCQRAKRYLVNYFNDQEIYISDLKIDINMDQKQITLAVNSLANINQQIKILEQIQNLFDFRLLVSLQTKLDAFFDAVLKSSIKTLDDLRTSVHKSSSNIKLTKIENEFKFLSILMETTLKKRAEELRNQYELELKNFKESVKKMLEQKIKDLNNDKIEDHFVFTLKKDIKKYFEYVIVLKNQCPTICEICFEDIQTFFEDILSYLQKIHGSYKKDLDRSKNRNYNINLNKLITLCNNHLYFDKYMEEKHKFEKLEYEITKSVQNNFSKTVIEINDYFLKNNFLLLKITFQKLAKDTSPNGRNSYRQGQQFLITKINELFNSLPNMTQFQENSQNFSLDIEQVNKIEAIFKIKNYVSPFIKDFKEYKMILDNTKSIFNIIIKLRDQDVKTINTNINNYELEQALLTCENLKRIQKILIIISEKENNQYQKKITEQINKKIREIQQTYLRPLSITITDQFLDIYRKTLQRANTVKIKRLKEEIDNKIKVEFEKKMKNLLQQTDFEKLMIRKVETQKQLKKLPRVLQQLLTTYLHHYQTLIQRMFSTIQNELKLILQMGDEKKIYNKLTEFQNTKNTQCINLILTRYENNLKQIIQKLIDKFKIQEGLKTIEQILQLCKKYEDHKKIIQISQNYIQIITKMIQDKIDQIIKKLRQYLKKEQFPQIQLLFRQIFVICRKYQKSVKQIQPLIKNSIKIFNGFFKTCQLKITNYLNNLNLLEIFEEDKIRKQIATQVKQLFQFKGTYAIMVQNIDLIDDVSITNAIKQNQSQYSINTIIQRFLAKVNEVNILLGQFSFNKLLCDKNGKAIELEKLKLNLLILKQYGGIYAQLNKQQIKSQMYYTKKIQKQIEQIFTGCKTTINTVQCLKTQSEYEKLNHQIQILQKYDEIFRTNKFINNIKQNLSKKIVNTTQQIQKLVAELQHINSNSVKQNKPLISSRQNEIKNQYKKRIDQKNQTLQKRTKNATSQKQREQLKTTITTQISDLQKQQNEKIDKIRQQEFNIMNSQYQSYEKRKAETCNKIADILILVKSIEIYIPIANGDCKFQITKIMKLYDQKLTKNNFKILAIAIQNRKGLSSSRLLSELPEFQGFNNKNSKKIQSLKIVQTLQNCPSIIKKYPTLKNLYENYNIEYQKLLSEYRNSKQSTIDKILSNMKQKASVLKGYYKSSKIHDGNLLIANIVSIWSILNAVQIQNKIEYRLTPHPAQIIAVFYLLGIGDSASKYSIANRAAEIEAGEGKSLILSIVSCYFGLLGYQVNIVCQTEDLCLRDQKTFKQLYSKIGIDQLIKYATINKTIKQNIISPNLSLINQVIQQQNKTLTNKVFGWLGFGDKKKQKVQLQKILLIDQINTIFQSDFYTGVYRPFVEFKHVCIQNLFTYIWTLKQQLTTQQIEKSEQFKECIQVFPYLESILKNHIKDMLYCAKNWQHNYFLNGGKIAYIKQSKITNELLYGYKSCFAYCNEVSRGKITQNTKNQYLYIMVTYDELLYSDLFINFKYALAVTQSYNKTRSLQTFHRINDWQIIPSASGKSKRIQKPIIVVNKDLFYDQIMKQINATLTQNRSVLVFFSNSIEANHFFYSSKYSDLREKYNNLLLEDSSEDQKNFKINKSTKSGMVTILTSFFAKGTDFVVSDEKLLQNGGLHVIQTFLSTSMIEQMQIKGRCARQGDKGSYRLILVEEQLQKLKIKIQRKQQKNIESWPQLANIINTKRAEHSEKLYQNYNSVRRSKREKILRGVKKSSNIFQNILCYNTFSQVCNKQHKIVIGLDVTASMSHTLEQIKRILPALMENLNRILNKQNLALQIFVYRNYGDPAPFIIQKSSFQTNPELLLNFLNTVIATGGYGSRQAIQLFYQYLNLNFFHQAILIGGAQQNTPQQVAKKREYFDQNYWLKNSRSQVFGFQQLNKIKPKRLPIHCIPTVTDRSVRQYFRKISEQTNGKFMNNYQESYRSDNLFIDFLLGSVQQLHRKIYRNFH